MATTGCWLHLSPGALSFSILVQTPNGDDYISRQDKFQCVHTLPVSISVMFINVPLQKKVT